MYWVSRK